MFENLDKTEERLKRKEELEKKNCSYSGETRKILNSILIENKELIRENYILGKNEPCLEVELNPLLIKFLEEDKKPYNRTTMFVHIVNDELRGKGIRVKYILKKENTSTVYVYLEYVYEEILKIIQRDNDKKDDRFEDIFSYFLIFAFIVMCIFLIITMIISN